MSPYALPLKIAFFAVAQSCSRSGSLFTGVPLIFAEINVSKSLLLLRFTLSAEGFIFLYDQNQAAAYAEILGSLPINEGSLINVLFEGLTIISACSCVKIPLDTALLTNCV